MKPLYRRFGFLYIRPGLGTTRQNHRILISYDCNDCDVIMWDVNLNPKSESDKYQITQLCNGKLEMVLNEETKTNTNNQIDHILADKIQKGRMFVTSYYNFVTDHT